MSTHTFSPKSLQDLHAILKRNAETQFFAGGTYLLRKGRPTGNILSIGQIEELRRITRNERYLEIGAGITLDRLLSIGRHVLPSAVYQAIEMIGNPAIRNLATIGGNLANREKIMNSFLPFFLLDARVEHRSYSSARWSSLSKLYDPTEGLQLGAQEYISRIRLPLAEWDYQQFAVLGNWGEQDTVAFCAFCKKQKSIIHELRFVISDLSSQLYRNREFEAILAGRKIATLQKDLQGHFEELTTDLGRRKLSPVQIRRGVGFLKRFIEGIAS